MASIVPEAAPRLFTPETLRSAARQSFKIHIVPVRLRRAIKKFIRETDDIDVKRKVLSLSESFNRVKNVNLLLTSSTAKELVDDPQKSLECSKRWKIKSSYGDIGLRYNEDESVAYVAARMPAVYSSCYRVLSEVQRRLPNFSPANVLDYGAGVGSVLWAVREVWPGSLKRINLIEPSKSMQRTGQKLIRDLKGLPLVQSYDSIQALSKNISKAERKHDLVVASYVLGEIPSVKDRITTVRQLWSMTRDVLVLVEPGTPHGFGIISQMRSHILWLEKRKCRKAAKASANKLKNLCSENGAFVVAPCPHDGRCPLVSAGKYCHFAQRLERTTTQHAYKRLKDHPLRGFEDEKFSFVVLKRGHRPLEPWPLDGVTFETLKEQHAKRRPEDLEIDYEDQFTSEAEGIRYIANPVDYDSDVEETETIKQDEDDVLDDGAEEEEVEEGQKEKGGEETLLSADLGSGWGRILFMPIRRGRRITMDVCRATKRDGSEGSIQRLVVCQSRNPTLHRQARRSLWGDLWPF